MKTLKCGKRSHLGAESTEKQATIYGASRAFESRMKREGNDINVWSEEDFQTNLDMLAPDIADGLEEELRTFKLWFEDWEEEWVTTRLSIAEARLLAKYGGIEFFDVDTKTQLVISTTEMELIRVKTSKGERVQGGWCILAVPKDLEKPTDDDYHSFNVGADSCIYYLIRRYHKSRMVLNLDETKYEKDEGETDSGGSGSETEIEPED